MNSRTGPWPFVVRPLTPNLGAAISGLKLADGLTDEAFSALYQAFLRYQVLLFPPQDLPPGRQVEFARRFGEVQVHVMNQYHADGFPELYRLSNLDAKGRPNGKHPDKGTLAWHTDGSWQRVTGQATIIYGEVMPGSGEGGETHFCDTYGAYERLSPAWKARIAGMRAVHNLDFSRNRRHGEEPMTEAQRLAKPPVDHPVVRTHPETGRKALYVNCAHTASFKGMTEEESAPLLAYLFRHQVRAEFTCRFQWRVGSLAFWDNRCTQHNPINDYHGQRRVMHRITLAGDKPR
jgi:taurine dioxygenase